MKLKVQTILILVVTFYSCTTMSYKKAVEELKNMPPPDYSFVIQPEFETTKENLESKLLEIYSGEEFKISAIGTYKYDTKTKLQSGERFWLKSILLNSSQIINLKDENQSKTLALQIAKQVIEEIENKDEYSKIEIVLMQQWDDGQKKSVKRNFFFTLPEYELSLIHI